MVFSGIDDQIVKLCEERDIKYTRYVDDLTLSSFHPIKSESLRVLEIIKNHNFRISNRKTKYATGSIEITGARVRNNGLSPTDKLKDKLDHPERYSENQVRGHEVYIDRLQNA